MSMMKEQVKDYAILITAFLGSVKIVLASFGIQVTQEFVEAIANLIAWGVVGYGIWKNTYVSPKARLQKEILERNGAIKK